MRNEVEAYDRESSCSVCGCVWSQITCHYFYQAELRCDGKAGYLVPGEKSFKMKQRIAPKLVLKRLTLSQINGPVKEAYCKEPGFETLQKRAFMRFISIQQGVSLW